MTASASSGADAGLGERLRLHLPAAEAEHVPDEQLGVDVGRRDAGLGEHPDAVVAQGGDGAWGALGLHADAVVSPSDGAAAPLRRPGCTTR